MIKAYSVHCMTLAAVTTGISSKYKRSIHLLNCHAFEFVFVQTWELLSRMRVFIIIFTQTNREGKAIMNKVIILCT